MARGAPIKRTLIGHSLYGEYNGQRLKWIVAIIDEDKAIEHGKRVGLENIKAYKIFKDEN